MFFFKIVIDGYIQEIGSSETPVNSEISQAEYSSILTVIRSRPTTTETTDYRLREDLTWEAYPVDPPDPDPDIDDTELLEILFGGAT